MVSEPVAVVLGANLNGLGMIRNFGRRGIRTVTVDHYHYMIGFFSKYSHERVCSKSRLAEALHAIGAQYRHAILFPAGDEFLELIIRHRDSLADYYCLPLPDNYLLKNILDKGAFYDLAGQLNVDIPKTWGCDEGENLEAIEFPCILKPAYGHVFRKYFPNRKVFVVREMSDLKKSLAYFSGMGLKMIVQEIIPGKDENQVSVAVYMDRNSVPLTTFVSRKVRQNPIGYGVGTYVEPYREDYIENEAKRILSRIGYKGIAEVEFRYDERDKRYKLIEINPRPWVQNELSSVMGRDVIFSAYCDLAGKAPYQAETKEQKTVWVFMVRDLSSALTYIRNGQMTFRELIKSYRLKKIEATWSLADPFPLLGFLYYVLVKGTLILCSKPLSLIGSLIRRRRIF